MPAQDIRPPVSLIPIDSEVANETNHLSTEYQRFLQQIFSNLNDLTQRGLGSLTLNPDFNWARTHGTTPTTQADGDNYAFIEQWNVFGSTGNTYTITPTPFASDAADNVTGSNYFVNLAISELTQPFYIYNVNYAPQYSYAQKVQNKNITISARIKNNLATRVKLRWTAAIEGITDEIRGKGIYIQPGMNNIVTTITMPSLKGTTAAANAYTQFRMYVDDMGGDELDLDIHYIKNEISGLGTNLDVDHLGQLLSIDAINSL